MMVKSGASNNSSFRHYRSDCTKEERDESAPGLSTNSRSQDFLKKLSIFMPILQGETKL